MSDWNDQVTLVKQTQSGQDSDGFPNTAIEEKMELYCNETSVKQQEYFAANAQKRNVQYCLEIHTFEDNGTNVAEYKGTRYEIYRRYKVPSTEITEIYLSTIK